jgi:hypothetical protein
VLPVGALHDFDITTIPIGGDVTFEVDHREPDGLFDLLSKAPFANVVRAALPIADVRINGNILVERKTVADFEASVIDPDKRLFNQAERMSFEPETLCFIIIEGDLYRQNGRMTMQQITGAFTYLSSIKGLSVLQVPDITATAYTLAKIAQHSRHGLGYNLALRTNDAVGPQLCPGRTARNQRDPGGAAARALWIRRSSHGGRRRRAVPGRWHRQDDCRPNR